MTYRSQGPSPIAAWLLIAINLVLYLVRVVNPEIVLDLGLLSEGFWDRPWTLVTHMFMHRDIWHILANMVTLYFFGSFLNRLLGTSRFLIVYFAGGIMGGLVFLLLPPSELSLAIGASGAIFALAGVLVVMIPNMRVLLYFIVPLPLWVAVIGIFIILFFIPNIAWQAHLGGLVLGLVAGYIFRRRRERYYL